MVITLLTALNSLGVKMGSAVQNVFTSAKVLALAAVVLVGLVAKNWVALAANFGVGWHNFWAGAGVGDAACGAGWWWVADGLCWVADDGGGGAGGVAVQLGLVEQRYVYGQERFVIRSGIFRLSLVIGTGVVLLLYVLCNFVYLSVLPLAAIRRATTIVGRGIQFASEDRVATCCDGAVLCGQRREADGCREILISTFWLCERAADGGARVYYAMSRDGLFFQGGREAEREVEDSGEFALGAVGVDLFAVPFGELWAVAGLRDLCGAGPFTF